MAGSLVLLRRCLRAAGQGLLALAFLVGDAPLAPSPNRSIPSSAGFLQNGVTVAGTVQTIPSAVTTSSPFPFEPVAPEPPLAVGLPLAAVGKLELTEKRTVDSATFDMGDGHYALVQGSRPMHYQDEEGAWRRIDPAFTAVANGWVNTTNAINTGLSPRSSKANLTINQSGVGWEPRALEVVNAAGQVTSLATPLPDADALTGTLSADARTVTYAGSWSDTALQDRWESAYGQAAYSLKIDKALTGFGSRSGFVDLRVTLHLFPGTQLQINGRPLDPAELPLETRDELAFVNAQGETLWLQPPSAYEEGNPAARVEGRYTLAAGTDASTVELAARIPSEWLAAADRQYPVVLDPVFQVRTGTVVRRARYHNDGSFWGNDNVTTPELGQFLDGVVRIMVKFALPMMPPNTVINNAYLVLAPTDINYATRNYLTVGAAAYALSNDTWISSGSVEPQYEATALSPIGDSTLSYSRGNLESFDSVTWDVTALAQSWAPTALNPGGTNYGVILRQTTEFCNDWSRPDCGGFYVADQFTKDDLRDVEAFYTRETGEYTPPPRGGIRLVVIYSGPTLNEGQLITGIAGGLSNPLSNDPYFHVDHEYRLQALPSHWQAAVARGLDGTFGPNPPTNYNDLYGQDLGGSVLMDLYDTADTAQTMDPPQASGLSYILLNGRGAAGQQYRLRVPPNTTSAPPNGYDIQVIGEKADLTVPINSSTVITYTWNGAGFDTHDPLALWNINLPSGSHARVDIDILAHNHQDSGRHPIPGTYDYARGFAGQLYLSGAAYRGASGSFRPMKSNVNPTDTAIPDGSVRLTSGTFTAGYVPYALALTYLGPQMTIYTCLGGGEFCSPQVAHLKFTYRVRVTACSGDTFPTRSGVCQEIKCPTTAFPPSGRVANVMGMQLWSENGWTSGQNNDGPAPLIGAMNEVAPTVAVVGGKITYDASAFTIDADSEVMLVNCGTLAVPTNPIDNNYFSVYANTAMESQEMYDESWIEPTTAQSASTFNPWRTEDVADTSGGAAPNVYPITGLVWNSVTLLRRTGNDLHFTVSYSTDYRGWPALQSTVTQVGADDPPDVAGTLILDLGETFSMDTTPAGGKDQARTFELVRASAATITQPDNLGGASKPVQAVLLGMGQKIPSDPAQLCIGNGVGCVDLRALDDTPADRLNPRRQWQMPDVHISGQPGMVVMSTVGNLQVYSVDHPNMPMATQDVGGQYSFDTFGAGVTVEMEPCAPGEPAVMVIRGETRMTMPNIGDGSNPDGVIAASFKLCQTKLRSVSFQFHSPVGLPIGSSGLFVTGMTGQVDLSPNYTQIKFTLDFQAAQGGDGGLMKGSGSVLIDTRGYFEFSGAGKILGVLNASGKLWVAWTPLDLGFEMNVSYSDWLTGMARAHMWEGQGWQHRYPWLPDNDERHIAAQIAATISIEEGAAFSWWFIDIPPWDIDFGIEVAFGQFCTNSSCTGYEWGVKGKFTIVGYDIGLYYGFDDGFDFILGNDDHVLIDQYGGATAMRASAAGVKVQQAALAVNGVATETFNVSADAESLLFALGWQAGAPQVTILDPNGVDAATGAMYTVAISETTYNRLIGVKLKQPTPGVWRAVLSNLTGQEHYKFVYLANKGAPGEAANPGHFLTPSAFGDNATGVYTLTWTVPPGTSPSATISLNYTQYYWVDNISTYWDADTRVKDVPIVKNLPFNTGFYHWDTSGLVNGYYGIRAIVDDGVNDIPTRPSYPKDSCQTRDELPSERAFDTQRFPGLSTFASFTQTVNPSPPGMVVITDTIAPAAPVSLTLKGVDSAILARWNPSPEKDVVGYLVRWGVGQRWGMPIQWHWVDYNEMRVSATVSPTVRLGGLSNEDPGLLNAYGVMVSAIDVNNNVSVASPIITAQPTGDAMSQVPSAPVGPTLGTITSSCTIYRRCTSTATLSWSPGAGPTPASYRLVYTRLSPSVVVAYTETTGAALTLNLTTGATYSVTVSAANSEGWRSGNSAGVQFVVTNGVDGDGDGMPDDWEMANTSLFKPAILPGGDEDNDGVTNLQEYQAQTSPWQQDGDGDGFSDQEEQQAGTDPLDSRSFPAQVTQPRLEINHRIVIRSKKGATEQHTMNLFYQNTGGGTLMLVPSSDSAWIAPMIFHLLPPFAGDGVRLEVDTSGLQPGFYSSIVRLNPAAGSQLIGEPQCIRVDTWVSPADDEIPIRQLYLPLVMRQ